MAPSANSLKGMTTTDFKPALSARVQSVAPSVTLAIAAKAKEMVSQGKPVISLSAGEPDFDTPSFIKDAAIKALQSGDTKYTPVTGTLELRKAIAAKLLRDQGLTYAPDQIVVGTGAKHAIFNVLFALLNSGDEVLIPAPYWLSYPEMVTVLGGKSVILETQQSSGFKITAEQLKRALTPKSKVLILNSPSNPTGAIYSREDLAAIAAAVKGHPGLVVLSDEIYEKLIFDGLSHVSIASLDAEMARRTVVVNGMSKAYSMTGWRLGYAACPTKELAVAVGSVQSHSTSNPTSFAQPGGTAALNQGEKDAADMRVVFEKRRTSFYDQIRAIPGLVPFKPQGAFYLFVDISKTGMDSLTFSDKLLTEAHVAVVPGKPFGSDKHIRMSFATSDAKLAEAATRIAAWLKK